MTSQPEHVIVVFTKQIEHTRYVFLGIVPQKTDSYDKYYFTTQLSPKYKQNTNLNIKPPLFPSSPDF